MTEEKSINARMEELCSRNAWDAEMIVKIRNLVRYTAEGAQIFREYAEGVALDRETKEERDLRRAVCAWLLSSAQRSAETVKAVSGTLKNFLEAEMAADAGNGERALAGFREAAKSGPDAKAIKVEIAAVLLKSENFDEALKTLQDADFEGNAEFHHVRARTLNALGRRDEACADFERSLAADPFHAEAKFHLAYLLDLRGEDDAAIALYQEIVEYAPSFIAALENLALLLEDKGDNEGAMAALKNALRAKPTARRAALHLRNVVESLDMYYDEGERKEAERLEAVMRLPLGDFELSVRSRNCLAKMGMKTLGELARLTDQDLMNFKNFGETSLREIRNLLESKGLRMGMNREDLLKRSRGSRQPQAAGTENPHIVKQLNDLEFSVRARKCMQRLNLETVADLCKMSEPELLAAKNFGQTSLNEIKKKLSELGLSLKAVQ
jgi:DNA-directed RNA polymerase subunit alpha